MRTERFPVLLCGLCLAMLGWPALAEVRIELVSGYAFAPGDAANHDSSSAYLSPDGRYLALTSQANNLVEGIRDQNGVTDALVLDRQTGLYDYVSVTRRCPRKPASAPRGRSPYRTTAAGCSSPARRAT